MARGSTFADATLAAMAPIIRGPRRLGLGFVAGEEEGAELDVEAFGHLAGDGAGALEGLGGGFGLGGVLVFEAPVDLAGLVGSGFDGEVEDLCGVVGGGADGPALDDLEFALGLLGGGELVDLVLLHGGDVLIFALDGVAGNAGRGERLDDGVGDAGAVGVGGVAVGAVGDEADVDGGGVGHDDDFVGGGDGDGAVCRVDLNGLGAEWAQRRARVAARATAERRRMFIGHLLWS